jgi:hypothetical protein
MRPVAFGEALPAGTRLTLFSDDKPIASSPSSNFGGLKPRVLHSRFRPAFLLTQVEDEEGRIHLLIHLVIEEQNEDRWCLWRPDHARFDLSVRSHN